MSIVIGADPDHIRIVTGSMITVDEIRRHFDELEKVIAEFRRRGRVVRVIVDLRASGEPPREVVGFIKGRTQALYGPEDRVALMVGPSFPQADQDYARAEQDFGVFHTEVAAEEFAFRHAPAERLPDAQEPGASA